MSNDKIDKLLQARPIPVQEIISLMMKASLLAEACDFATIERIAYLDDTFDQTLAYPAMALLPAWKKQGVETLGQMAIEGPHHSTAFGVLAAIALGRVPTSDDVHFLGDTWDSQEKYKLGEGLSDIAEKQLRTVVLEHLTDTYSKGRLLSSISAQAIFAPDNNAMAERLDFLVGLLIDSQIVLNETILQEFETLLNNCPKSEEELHRFADE